MAVLTLMSWQGHSSSSTRRQVCVFHHLAVSARRLLELTVSYSATPSWGFCLYIVQQVRRYFHARLAEPSRCRAREAGRSTNFEMFAACRPLSIIETDHASFQLYIGIGTELFALSSPSGTAPKVARTTEGFSSSRCPWASSPWIAVRWILVHF